MNPRYLAMATMAVTAHAMSVAHADNGIVISPKVEVLHVDFSGSYSGMIGGVAFDNGYDISVQALRVGVSAERPSRPAQIEMPCFDRTVRNSRRYAWSLESRVFRFSA